MAITKEKELYEVLIRFGGGEVKGGHVIYSSKIKEDGSLIAETLDKAEKISVLDGDTTGYDLVTKIIPEINIDQLKTIDTLTTENTTLKTENDVLKGK